MGFIETAKKITLHCGGVCYFSTFINISKFPFLHFQQNTNIINQTTGMCKIEMLILHFLAGDKVIDQVLTFMFSATSSQTNFL